MAKIKYDVSGTDPEANKGKAFEQPKPGVYKAKLQACKLGHKALSSGKPDPKAPRIEVVYEIVKGEFEGSRLYDYIPLQESTVWRLDQFLQAFGVATVKRRKGEFDPEELVDLPCVLRVRHEAYTHDGITEMRAKVAAVMQGSDEDLDDYDVAGVDEEEELEGEDEELEDEESEEEEEEEEQDFSEGYPRSYLQELADTINETEDADATERLTEIASEFDVDPDEIETWDEVVTSIIEAQGLGDLDEEEEEETEEEEEEQEEEDSWDAYSLSELKEAAKERDLPTTGTKAALVARLEKYDSEEEPF